MTARLWKVASQRSETVLQEHTGFLFGVSFLPDGKLLATGSDDCTAQLRSQFGPEAELAPQLLQATGVCLTPGNGFGSAGEGYARLALVHPSDQLEAGAQRMARWLDQL